MSAIFLLGAGASRGSLDCHPDGCPPVGSGPDGLFVRLAERGGIAATVTSPLRERFIENFEAGMVAFMEARETDTTAFLRDMARYLVRFAPGMDNLYHRLIEIVRRSRRESVLVTTNYDVLIEHAISEAGLFASYKARPVEARNIPLLKIHGSCHFLLDTRRARFRHTTFRNGGSESNVELPVWVASNGKQVIHFCDTEDSLAPAMAVSTASR